MLSNPDKTALTGTLLVTLLLSAFFTAQGATGLLAHSLFSSEGRTAALPGGGSQERLTRQTRDKAAIVTRNIFGPDVSLFPSEAGGAGGEEGGGEEAGEGSPAEVDDGVLQRCDGGVRLVAAVVHPKNTAASVAALAQGTEKAMLFREGMKVGEREIVAIAPHRVILRPTSGRRCEVPMWSVEMPGPIRSAAPSAMQAAAEAISEAVAEAATPAASNDRNAGLSTEEMNAGITKVSDTQYTVTRDIFDRVLADPGAIQGLARGIAHEENGQTVGAKLYGIRRTALLGRLGVQNGDMLRTVNGFDVGGMQGDMDSALNALTTLRGASNLSLSVIRRGKPVTLEYTVN